MCARVFLDLWVEMLGHEICTCSALQETQLSKTVKSIFMSTDNINCSLCSHSYKRLVLWDSNIFSICRMNICMSLWFKLLFFWLLMSLWIFPCVCWPFEFYPLWNAWYIFCYFSIILPFSYLFVRVLYVLNIKILYYLSSSICGFFFSMLYFD